MKHGQKALILAMVTVKIIVIEEYLSGWREQHGLVFYGVMLASLFLLFYIVYKMD